MGFVYEPMTTEDRRRLALRGIRARYGAMGYWAVDHQVGASLACWGGRGATQDRAEDPPDAYSLILPDGQLAFDAWRVCEYSADGDIYRIEITRLYTQRSDPAFRSEVEDLIRAGMEPLWRGISSRSIKAVEVTFPASWSSP